MLMSLEVSWVPRCCLNINAAARELIVNLGEAGIKGVASAPLYPPGSLPVFYLNQHVWSDNFVLWTLPIAQLCTIFFGENSTEPSFLQSLLQYCSCRQ